MKASEESEAELVVNDKLDELMIDGEHEELDGGLKPYDSDLPDASVFYRVIRAGGECDPPGTTDDVCEPGTGTKCLPVPGKGINRCIVPTDPPTRRTIVPAGGVCVAGDVCVDGYNCINRMCVVRYGGICNSRDICQSGYSCINGRCGTQQPTRKIIVPAGGVCVAGDVCGGGYNCINRMCVVRYGGVCNSRDICQSGYSCVDGSCGVIAPTGTCIINCQCYNNDCGACNTNCNCFGDCCMPSCSSGCNYNGGTNICPPAWVVMENNNGDVLAEE